MCALVWAISVVRSPFLTGGVSPPAPRERQLTGDAPPHQGRRSIKQRNLMSNELNNLHRRAPCAPLTLISYLLTFEIWHLTFAFTPKL